jgi:hypothetical protein
MANAMPSADRYEMVMLLAVKRKRWEILSRDYEKGEYGTAMIASSTTYMCSQADDGSEGIE